MGYYSLGRRGDGVESGVSVAVLRVVEGASARPRAILGPELVVTVLGLVGGAI